MNGIRAKIGKNILRRKARELKRHTIVQNFQTAKHAAIVFNTSVPNAFPEVKVFRKKLAEIGISCEVFGYVNQKEVPDDMLLWEKFSYITRKDLNWYYKPSGEVADRYFSLRPDILFDLTFDQSLPIRFLVYLSNAKFKVGCFTEDENDYDLMINQGKKCEIRYLIEQFQHYINILQPSS